MEALEASLIAIEAGLERLQRATLIKAFRAGLEPQQTRDHLARCGLKSTAEVEELYRWRNGSLTEQLRIGDISLWPGFYFPSLEEAVVNYKAFVEDPRWPRGCLPIFADGGGDFYLVNLSGDSVGAVKHFWIDESEQPLEFRSIERLLATIARCYEEGIFMVNSQGHLDMDDHEFARVARELNPDVDWWSDIVP